MPAFVEKKVKGHSYWYVTTSVRGPDGKPKEKVLLYLGGTKQLGQWIIAHMDHRTIQDVEVEGNHTDADETLDRVRMLEVLSTHEKIGEHRRMVKTIRRKMQKNPASLNEDVADDFDLPLVKLHAIMEKIRDHPEWDDREVAMNILWDE